MNYKELNGYSIREGFNQFNKDNPHVFKAFEEQAFAAINRGRKKISSKLIINWIRWNEFLISMPCDETTLSRTLTLLLFHALPLSVI